MGYFSGNPTDQKVETLKPSCQSAAAPEKTESTEEAETKPTESTTETIASK